MKRIYTILFVLCAFAYTTQAQIAISEGFEGGIPNDWTIITNATDGGWLAGSIDDAASAAWALPDHGGGNVAVTNDDACNCDKSNDWLITPALDLSGMTNPQLSFDRAFGGYSYQGNMEMADVQISTDGGSTWTVLESLVGEGTIAGATGTPTWVNEGIDLSAYAGMTVQIGFHYSDGNGWLYAYAIDNVLVFQPLDWEIELVKLTIDPIHQGGEEVAITGQVKNLGSNNVTSFDLAWTDGTNNYSETISGVDIGPFGTYDFIAGDKYTTSAGVSDQITVTISNPNGNTDGDASNNEQSANITGISFIPVKRVVTEEATGTWCGWCPRGTVGLEYMAATYPESHIGIAVHNNDPMAFAEYDGNMNVGGYPSSNVDRAVNDTDPNRDNLEMIHNQRIGMIVAANIDQMLTYDQATRAVTIDVTSEFVAPASDYRFSFVVVEDSVTGTSSGYAQANYYSAQSQNIDLFSLDGTNYKDLPATIPASEMVYDHVGRALPVGFHGEAGSLPAMVNAGETHSHTFNYTLPAEYNENHIHIVAMLLDNASGEIVNAVSTALDVSTSLNDLNFNENLAKIFPNPFSDISTISLDLANPAEVTISVFNQVGQLVGQERFGQLAGEQTIPLNGSNLAEGMYYVHITVGDQVVTKKVTIVR